MSSVSAVNSLLSSSSTTSSSSIDLSSLLTAATDSTSTGIDVNSAVAAAIYAAQAPERQWQTEQTTAKSQITTLTSIQTALSAVTTDLNSLNNLTGPLTARTTTSSIPSVVTATAADGATIGSHVVSVSALAQAATWYSPSLTSNTSPLGNTTLQIVGANGTTSSYTTGSGVNSLSQLASAINSGSSGVTASIVSDSNGSRLSLVSATGAANDFTVSYGAVSGSAWSSADVASASTALTAGSFQIGDGTNSATISVNSGQTLNDVANSVNNAGLNVTASVVTDSTGAHLSLAPTGPSSSVTVTGDPTFTGTQASSASNASLTVDGVPVSSASNTVTGAINGVTLNLLGTTTYTNTDGSTGTAQATIGVAADASQMTSAVSQLVTDYNSALSLVNSQFSYSATNSSQGVLSGNSDIRSLQSTLLGIGSYTTTDSSSSSSSSTQLNLSSLGITMGDDGTLSLDTTTLNSLASSSPSSVQNFFQGTALNGFAQNLTSSLNSYTDPATGSLALGISDLNTTYTNLQSQVNDYESGYIASQRTVLTAMYSQAEIALQSLPTTLKQLQAELTNNSGN